MERAEGGEGRLDGGRRGWGRGRGDRGGEGENVFNVSARWLAKGCGLQ